MANRVGFTGNTFFSCLLSNVLFCCYFEVSIFLHTPFFGLLVPTPCSFLLPAGETHLESVLGAQRPPPVRGRQLLRAHVVCWGRISESAAEHSALPVRTAAMEAASSIRPTPTACASAQHRTQSGSPHYQGECALSRSLWRVIAGKDEVGEVLESIT